MRRYAKKIASDWGVAYTRFSPSFFSAVDEASRRAIAQLVLANGQGKPRKTLR